MKTLKTMMLAKAPARLTAMFGDDGDSFHWRAVADTKQARIHIEQPNVQPQYHLRRLPDHPDNQVFILFKANQPPTCFDFPIEHAQTNWCVGLFGPSGWPFQNGLFVGTWSQALTVWATANSRTLERSFADYVAKLSPAGLTKIKTDLTQHMLNELEDAERGHQQHIASIRGRYRNRLNFFTSLHDEAQDKLDKQVKATYTFELLGYPLSREYASYKEARRAHSKRNVPNVECVITRKVKRAKGTMHTQTFARWSTADRVWNLL